MSKSAKEDPRDKNGKSKYQVKLARREEALQNYHNERSTPQESSIITKISYTKNQVGKPGVRIMPKRNDSMIYSFLAISQEQEVSYGIRKRWKKREYPIMGTSFKKLYNDPWIKENEPANLELQAIEKTVRANKKSIEGHLGVFI